MAKSELTKNINQALNNENMRGALSRFADAYIGAREKAFEGKDFSKFQEDIKSIKQETVRNLSEYADQFEENVRSKGGNVFRAKDAKEANEYILSIFNKHQSKHTAKSKSMATEEIHLNHFLAEHGIEAVETDLGEWIIQLAGQRPSHMVMPAIHMTRGEVAEVFSKHLKETFSDDVELLVKVAKKELRKEFLKADIGISGANIAVAETGTLMLMTNEGNARLCTTLPKVHIAVLGYEKIVPTFKDATPIIEALPKNATGQKITSYVTMINGCSPTIVDKETGEVGTKELHVILLDNGRLEMAKDEVFKEAYQCIRCAACLNVCPVYRFIGGHVFGHVYAGAIGIPLTHFFNSKDAAYEMQSLCTACGLCNNTCPGDIDIAGLILESRQRLTDEKGLPKTQQLIFEKFLSNRKLFHASLRAASKLQKPVTKGQPMIRHLPLFFSKMTEFRSLPAIADVPLRDYVLERERIQKANLVNDINSKVTKGKIGLYAGCLIDFVYTDMGKSVIEVLEAEGYEVVFPQEQNCCGAPAYFSGDMKSAATMAKQNIEAFENLDVEYIVTACPTCTSSLKDHFTHWLEADPAWKERAVELGKKVQDFSQLVHNLRLKNGQLLEDEMTDVTQSEIVTYHDSCHLKRHLKVDKEPRKLIRDAGFDLVEMHESDRCCGFAGSYSIKMPDLSAQIINRKIKHIEESGADILAVDCPGCYMQIIGALDKTESQVKTKHTAELLAEQLRR